MVRFDPNHQHLICRANTQTCETVTKPYGATGGKHLNEWDRCHPASSLEFGNSGKSLIEGKE